jgi:hypothetical protein
VYPWPIVRCEIVGGQSLDYKLASHLPWDGIRTACARGVATAACRGTSNRGDCWVMSQAGADPRGRAAPRWLSAGDAVRSTTPSPPAPTPTARPTPRPPAPKDKDGDPENTPDARIAQGKIGSNLRHESETQPNPLKKSAIASILRTIAPPRRCRHRLIQSRLPRLGLPGIAR